MKLEGKVALITGGAGVIGRAAARRLHDEGATIVLVDKDEVGVRAAA
jgi:NAD(P)-dependent dehydrogenase (short-subunit alcohol dehydrogenase family)